MFYSSPVLAVAADSPRAAPGRGESAALSDSSHSDSSRSESDAASAAREGDGDETSLDRDGFQRFYDRTSAPLRRYLQRVCSDPARGEDVFQESYVRLINRPGLDLDDERLKSYLFRTATNLLRDHWRRSGREREGLLQFFTQRRDRSAPPPSGARLDLDAALATLGPRDRAMLWLAYVEGYGHRDIASMVGVRPGSVRVLLFRLRQRLADQLESVPDTDPDPEADVESSGGAT